MRRAWSSLIGNAFRRIRPSAASGAVRKVVTATQHSNLSADLQALYFLEPWVFTPVSVVNNN